MNEQNAIHSIGQIELSDREPPQDFPQPSPLLMPSTAKPEPKVSTIGVLEGLDGDIIEIESIGDMGDEMFSKEEVKVKEEQVLQLFQEAESALGKRPARQLDFSDSEYEEFDEFDDHLIRHVDSFVDKKKMKTV